MRRASATLLIALLLVCSAPLAHADSKGVVACAPANLPMLPAMWDVDDQSCVKVDLGELDPGEVLSFDLTTDLNIDILLFSDISVSVYLNEQAYRSDSIWERNSVFEDFNGTGSWHWTVPDDREKIRWYLVLDNLAHPQDDGGGAQGGSIASISLESEMVTSETFTLADTIVRLDPGEHAVLHGPFVVDAGTQVRMDANTMEGAPDVFLMTYSQMTLYEQGGTAAARVEGTDMLLITQERDMVWMATETYEGEDLYLMVDNRAGPAGGGAGTEGIAVTVTLSLIPVLEPVISGDVSLGTINIWDTVTLDATQTPNNSGQIPESGFHWDTTGDGDVDTVGSIVNIVWDEPTSVDIRLTVVAIDGRSASLWQTIEIADISNPVVSLDVVGILERSYGDDVTISGHVSDNWGIATIEWLVDDVLIRTNSGSDEGATVFSHTFNSSYAAGPHTVTLRATDNSGREANDTATISLQDSTPPVIGINQREVTLRIGETFPFEANVSDPESKNPLLFSWDFDSNVDSDFDGDPRNDIDGVGYSVPWSYNVSGPKTVVCKIVNEAGLVAEFEVLVNVLSGSEEDGMDLMQLGLMVAGALVVVIMIGLLVWRFMSNRRLAAMIAEDDQPEQVASAVPSIDEQKAMWGGAEPAMQTEQPAQQVFGDISSGMSGSTLGISTAMGEPEGDELDPDIAALLQSSSESGPSDSSAANELLSEFDDDDSVEREDVDFSHESETEETVSNWSPGEDETEVFQPKEIESEPDRKVRQNCSSCDKKFEVELPSGIDAARTACPHCGSIESVSLD